MEWLYKSNDPLLETVASSAILFVFIIIIIRIIGLRSFAKFTAYDFAFTVAVGSILSAILTSSTSIVHGAIAITSVLVLTYLVSFLEKNIPALSNLLSNDPLLLMDGDTFLKDNMKKAQIEKSQIIAKLREANVLDLNQVEAVVLEATGDISVLHKSSASSDEKLHSELLEGVQK